MNEALAIFLANRYADAEDAIRPKAREIHMGKFQGAAGAAHALGIGMTPAMVEMWVIDAYRAAGPRPTSTAFNQDRRVWTSNMVARILRSCARAGYEAKVG